MFGKSFVKAAALTFAVLGLLALSGRGQEPKYAEGTQYKVIQWEMKLRVLEGVREGAPAAPAVVTSSFLRYTFSANFLSEENLAEEQGQVKRIFNLKDARLLTEGQLDWRIGKPEKVDYVFRLDGKEYLIRVRGGDLNAKPGSVATQSFGVEVFEIMTQTIADKIEKTVPIVAKKEVSLLDTEFTVSSLKNVTVFGFEDSQGKPYFISLRQTKMYADEAVVKRSGVAIGQVVSGITPPKLVKQVDPVYPEIAKQAMVSGVVVVEATIDANGRVARVAVLRSIPLLDQAAVDAVRQWVYEPMIVDGQPRPVVLTTSVQFMLAKDRDGKVRGITGGATGGVEGGVEGKVVGWVDPAMLGGVEGGVEGGVLGGVVGQVLGGVEGGVTGVSPEAKAKTIREREEFEKDALRATGAIKPPLLIKAVDPVYPEIARQAQIEGVVILEIRADEKGNVEAARILRSIPLLDQAAIDAVKQWKYEPLVINGKPQKILFTVTVRFMMKPGDKEKALDKFAEGAVKAEGSVKPPLLIKAVDPVYPEEAKKAGIEGVVILAAKTDATGHVQDVMVLRSIPMLNQAAVDAVKQWAYEPMIINNVAQQVVFTVTVRFQLDSKKKAGSSGVVGGVVGGVLGGVPGKEQQEFAKGAVRAMDTIRPPALIKSVDPVYPEKARQAQVEGMVILEVRTDEKGNVEDARVLRSIPVLDQAAIDAVKQWKYEPLVIDGKPKKILFTVSVQFRLK
jgi:TonB family protein